MKWACARKSYEQRCDAVRLRAATDRSPAEPPRQGKEPHPPELGPDAESSPRVAAVLVAIARDAHDQRREQRRSCRGPTFPTEEPGPEVDAHRPAREQEIEGSREGPVRSDREREVRRQGVREALIVVEERRSELEVRIPAVERHMPALDPVQGPTDHRLMDRAVVQLADGQHLGAENPEVERDGKRHDRERHPSRSSGVRWQVGWVSGRKMEPAAPTRLGGRVHQAIPERLVGSSDVVHALHRVEAPRVMFPRISA